MRFLILKIDSIEKKSKGKTDREGIEGGGEGGGCTDYQYFFFFLNQV